MSVKHACPHCATNSLDHELVMTLGPIRSVPCPNCGRFVSVSFVQGLRFLVVFLGPSVVCFAALAISLQVELLSEQFASRLVPLFQAAILLAIPAFMFPIACRTYAAHVKLVKRKTVADGKNSNRGQ